MSEVFKCITTLLYLPSLITKQTYFSHQDYLIANKKYTLYMYVCTVCMYVYIHRVNAIQDYQTFK